jgi:hypothetical protein
LDRKRLLLTTLVAALGVALVAGLFGDELGAQRSNEPPRDGSALPASGGVPSAPAPPAPRAQLARVPGISMPLPLDWRPLDPAKLERIRLALEEADPGATVQVDTYASKRGPLTVGMVTRSVHASPRQKLRGTVRDTLELTVAELELRQRRAGRDFTDWKASYGDDRVDLDARYTAVEGTQRVEHSVRTVLFLSKSEEIVVVGATCSASDGSACEPILRAVVIEDEPRRSFDEVVGEPVLHPRVFAGFEFGMSRAAFVAACRSAKLPADRFDWASDTPLRRKLFEAGEVARCDGAPGKWEGGNVSLTEARFENDRLVGVTLASSDELGGVRERLHEAYPGAMVLPAEDLVFIDVRAQGDDPYVAEMYRVDSEVQLRGKPVRLRSTVNYSSRGLRDRGKR